MLGPAAQRGVAGRAAGRPARRARAARRTTRAGRSAPGRVALAEVLDRRVDVVEIGYDGGARGSAVPGVGGGPSSLDLAVVPTAALAPADPDDAVIDRVSQWSTWGADRHRLRDRMRELRIAPWADATGEGATLRMAAARAALGRLGRGDPGVGRPAGGRPRRRVRRRLGGRPGPERRARPRRRPAPAGAGQFALDHARILAPLGSIPDPDERRAMVLDLVDDLLAPLGTFVTPAGMRPGPERRLGRRPRRRAARPSST